ATGIPLFLVLIAMGLEWIETRLARTSVGRGVADVTTRHWVTLLVLAAVLFAPPISALDLMPSLPARIRASAAQEPTDPLIGYAAAPEFPAKTLSDLRTVVATYVEPDEPLFDFSNEPGIFSFLIDRPLATRYFHVSMAID